MGHFDELVEINKRIIQEEDNIRVEVLDEVYKRLDDFYSKDFNLDKFIKLCITLFNMQIFYDGNSRTIYTYLKKVLEENNYYIDDIRVREEFKEIRNFFPVMYDLNEEVNDNMVNRINAFISIESKGKTKCKK